MIDPYPIVHHGLNTHITYTRADVHAHAQTTDLPTWRMFLEGHFA